MCLDISAIILQGHAADEARVAIVRGPQGLLRARVRRGRRVGASSSLGLQVRVGRGHPGNRGQHRGKCGRARRGRAGIGGRGRVGCQRRVMTAEGRERLRLVSQGRGWIGSAPTVKAQVGEHGSRAAPGPERSRRLHWGAYAGHRRPVSGRKDETRNSTAEEPGGDDVKPPLSMASGQA